MAKSMSTPWLETTLVDLIAADAAIDDMDDAVSIGSKGATNRKYHHVPKVVQDFQYIGGHDLEKLNNPTSVNSSTQVKSLIDKQAYRLIVKRLAFRQFNGRYLPQADGEEGAGDERFAEDGWTLTREHLFPVNEAGKSSGSPDSVTIISGAAITFLHSEISRVIQLLDTQVPTQLVPQELLMTQVDSQAEGPMAGTQVPDDSQSTGDRTQQTVATLAASPAAARARPNGSQTPPAPASSYQEVASRLEQDLLASSLRLEERLGVFSPATQVPLPMAPEDGAAKGSVDAPSKTANFVMDDGDGVSTAGSADWSKPFPPPLWPVRTAAAPQAVATGSSSSSGSTNVAAAVQAVSGTTNSAAETVVVPFVLPKVGPVTGENSDDDDDDDLIMTQPQTRFRGSQATDTPESTASSTVSRTKRRTRPSATADIDLEALQLKQQMDALLADYDNDRNAMALEAGIVSDAETSRDGRQTRSRSGLSRFFRRKETATRGAAKSMETIEERDDEDDAPSASTAAPQPRPGSLMAKFIARESSSSVRSSGMKRQRQATLTELASFQTLPRGRTRSAATSGEVLSSFSGHEADTEAVDSTATRNKRRRVEEPPSLSQDSQTSTERITRSNARHPSAAAQRSSSVLAAIMRRSNLLGKPPKRRNRL
eukprot:gene2816-2046_t